MDFNKKKIIVTGASSGIGKEIVRLLSAYDCTIIAVGQNKERTEESAKIAGAKAEIIPYVCDISRKESIDALFGYAENKMGGIDLFAANAGIGYFEKIKEPDWGRMNQIYSTNFFSPIYSLEKMLARGKKFNFAITSSSAGFFPLPGYALYASTKAALNVFAKDFRYEENKLCTLTIAYPIGTRTEFFRNAGNATEPSFSQSAEEVAKAIVEGIRKDKKEVYTSTVSRIFFAADKFLPFLTGLYVEKEKKKIEGL